MPYDVQANGKNGGVFRTITNNIDTDNLDDEASDEKPPVCSCHDEEYPPFTGEIHASV